MERLEQAWARVAELWERVLALPDLGLPAPEAPGAWIVAATILLALGLAGLVSGWAGGRLARLPLLMSVAGAGLFVWLWDADREGFGPRAVPEAFAEIAAALLR